MTASISSNIMAKLCAAVEAAHACFLLINCKEFCHVTIISGLVKTFDYRFWVDYRSDC